MVNYEISDEELKSKYPKEKKIKCPKDKTVMAKLRHPNGNYIIDKCPKCLGIFLDKNEIENIRNQSFWQYIKNWFMREDD